MNDKNRNLVVRVATALVLLPLVLWLISKGGLPFALLIAWAAAASALELNLLGAKAAALLGKHPGPDDPASDGAPPDAAEARTRKERRAARAAAQDAEAARETGAGTLTGAAVASIGAAFLLPVIDYAPLSFLSAKMVFTALVIVAFVDALFFEPVLARTPLRVGMAVLGAAYPGLLLSALVPLRALPMGGWWIVLALVVTWFNDTGAYFAGRAFGRRKLYPRISPSKTVEGAVGGMLGSVAGGIAVKLLFLPALPLWGAAVIGAGAAILGPLGDLSESMLKRAFGAKDSGRMIPGHGGILDRIDALLFTAPFVLLCARLFAP